MSSHNAGKPALVHATIGCDKLHALIAALPPCVVGMEACSGARHSSAGKASSRRREIGTILGGSDTRKLKLTTV